MYRDFAVQSQALRTEQDTHRKQTELEERLRQKLDEAQRDRELETRKVNKSFPQKKNTPDEFVSYIFL